MLQINCSVLYVHVTNDTIAGLVHRADVQDAVGRYAQGDGDAQIRNVRRNVQLNSSDVAIV